MDLFTLQDKKKQFYEDGVVLILKSDGKFKIGVTETTITLNAYGAINFANKGFTGVKTIPINSITALQYKKPGFSVGYLQFILLGSPEIQGGANAAFKDENTVTFLQSENHLILQLKEFLEYKIANRNDVSNKVINPASSALDEIKKLKELLDIGAITQDEFEAKKKQLLDL